jgi:hypothetical protein
MEPNAPLQIMDLSHSWRITGAKEPGFSFIVVTGWLDVPGVTVDEHIEIVGESGQVVAMSPTTRRDQTTGKDGRAIILTLMTIDPDAVSAGRYLVQVFSGREMKLEYPIDLQ